MLFISIGTRRCSDSRAPAEPPDSGVQNAGQNQRNLAAMAYGAQQTILTGPQGLTTPANTTGSGKTLLGG